MLFKKSRHYMCSECKGKFDFEDIKYGMDGKRIICKDCYIKAGKDYKNKEIKTVLLSDASDYVKLICVDCRYKFSLRKKSRFNLICPYCSSRNLMKDDITADKLIEEVSQIKDY